MCCCIGRCVRRCSECVCALLVSAGLLVLVYWAVYQPRHIRATNDGTALFTFSSNPTSNTTVVSYKLTVNLSLYNPSVRAGIYYDAIDARLLRFLDRASSSSSASVAANSTSPSQFFQRRKSGTVVTLEFAGQSAVADAAARGEMEKDARVDDGELEVRLRVRYVLGIFKVRQKPSVRCWISVPPKADGRGAAGERCRVKY